VQDQNGGGAIRKGRSCPGEGMGCDAFFCAACLLEHQKSKYFHHLQARLKLLTAEPRKKMHRTRGNVISLQFSEGADILERAMLLTPSMEGHSCYYRTKRYREKWRMSKLPFVPTKEYRRFIAFSAAWRYRSLGLCSGVPCVGTYIHQLRMQVERIVQIKETQIVTKKVIEAARNTRLSHA
jgi:hypothetical protein